MALEDEINSENSSNFTFEELFDAFNEFMDEFNKLRLKNKELKMSNIFLMKEKNFLAKEKEEMMKSEKSLVEENFELKKEYDNLKLSLKENENLRKEKQELMGENEKLRKEIEILKLVAKKFNFSFQKLQLMGNSKKAVFNKAKTDFNSSRKQQYAKNMFTKVSLKNDSIKCFKCNQIGHKISECNIKRINHILVK